MAPLRKAAARVMRSLVVKFTVMTGALIFATIFMLMALESISAERDAKRLFPRERWNDLHLQIILYGREYCPARGFDLNKCVITREFGRKSFINEVLKEQEKKQKLALKKKRK